MVRDMAEGAYSAPSKAPRSLGRQIAVATLAAVSLCLSSVASQAAQPNSAEAAVSEAGTANPYAELDNEQLAGLADIWQELDRDQRRWFFVEVRNRLVAKGGPPRIPIRSSARFGQVVRNRDGKVVRVEAVRVSERLASGIDTGAATDKDPRAYGLGFERRTAVEHARERQTVAPQPASGTSRAVRPPPPGGR